MSLTNFKKTTPCQGVCSATALGDDVCKGCNRPKEEVIDWAKIPKEYQIEYTKMYLDEIRNK